MAKAATTTEVTGAGAGGKAKGILKTFPVSQPLANFAGENELSRGSAVKKVWEYVKLHNLQVRVFILLKQTI